MKLSTLPLAELSVLLDKKEITPSRLILECLEHIHQLDAEVGAFLTVTEQEARDAAAHADKRCADGKRLSPLDGIPYALKDNFVTEGIRTTAGSRMLEHFIPCTDAAVVDKLRRAGAVLIGKCNMDEFGMGNTTEFSAFRPTRNPLNTMRVPGGSSGGCAAAVSAGMAVFAVGSDTGGSVRQPAAFCGITGLKPTYGAVSRNGLIAFASSLDTVGILARKPGDCLLVEHVLSSADPCDMTVHPIPSEQTDGPLPAIALFLGADEDKEESPAVRLAFETAVQRLRAQGCSLHDAPFPDIQSALSAYYIISSAEASSNLARYDGIRFGSRAKGCTAIGTLYDRSRADGLGSEVKRRILLGTYVLSEGSRRAFYDRACRVRETLHAAFDRIFEHAGLILCPTVPCTAFPADVHRKPVSAYHCDRYTVPASLCGLPSISIPFGLDRDGMPCALQLIAKAGTDGMLCRHAETILHMLSREVSRNDATYDAAVH